MYEEMSPTPELYGAEGLSDLEMEQMMNPELYGDAELYMSGADAAAGVAILGLGVFMLFFTAVMVITIISMWKIFTKAGQPGWKSIIPFYNIYIMAKMLGRPGWWMLLMLIPFIGMIWGIILTNDLSKSFGKGVGYTIGLLFVGIIFYPMLAFGDAKFLGPVVSNTPQNPNPMPSN